MEHFLAPKSSSNSLQLLRELEALSASLDRSPAFSTCKAACLEFAVGKTGRGDDTITSRASDLRSRHASFSYWCSREKKHVDDDEEEEKGKMKGKRGLFSFLKPMRTLSRIGKQKVSCLFCVEVVAVRSLPASMNGQHLVVCVKKKDSKSGAVRTLPSKVSRGCAEFEETLFVTCHVYFSLGSGTTNLNFEPRPFVIFALGFDGVRELDCGRSYVDLSKLIQESIEKSFEDAPVRQWDTSINMSGKAEGGKLSLKLSFQIMEKDGIGTYIRGRQNATAITKGERSCSFARRQSKTPFSVPTMVRNSKRIIRTTTTEDVEYEVVDKGVEVEEVCKKSAAAGVSSEVVVKEVMHHHHHDDCGESKLRFRMAVLDSIAEQIKELESILLGDKGHRNDSCRDNKQGEEEEEEMITREFIEMLHDDDDEGEDSEGGEKSNYWLLAELGDGLGCVVQTRNEGFLASINPLRVRNNVGAVGAKREGPRLAMQMSKPLVLNIPQHSPIMNDRKAGRMIEVLQSLAAGLGVEGMTDLLSTLMPIDELMGKSAEQIAFEGIASQIIHPRGTSRNNSSTAAQNRTATTPTSSSSSFMRRLAVVKSMANAMNSGDKSGERCTTAADVLGFSIRKLEEVIIDALKIQAGFAGEETMPPPPSDFSSVRDNRSAALFEGAVSLQEWLMRENRGHDENLDMCFVVQLRDPLRQYEVVGGPMLVLMHAVRRYGGGDGGGGEEKIGPKGWLEVGELHVVGILMRGNGGGADSGCDGGGGKGDKNKSNNDNNNNNNNNNVMSCCWDNNISREKERMSSAMQWLMGNGLVNNYGRNSLSGGGGGGGVLIYPHHHGKREDSTCNKNVMWSISSLGRSSIAAGGDG